MTAHDFHEQLAYSEEASEESFWKDIYNEAFPDHLLCQQVSGDTISQRRGVDRLIYMPNDRVIRIDEKKRKKVYRDVLLEYISVDTTGAPGWMEKDLNIDYIAYAWMPIQKVYLLDWLHLKRAWRMNKEDWLQEFKTVPAQNNGYVTLSVAIPNSVIMQEVARASIIDLGERKPFAHLRGRIKRQDN